MANDAPKANLLSGFSALNKSDPAKTPEQIAAEAKGTGKAPESDNKDKDAPKPAAGQTTGLNAQGQTTIASQATGSQTHEVVGRSSHDSAQEEAIRKAASQVTGEYEEQNRQGSGELLDLVAESMQADPLAMLGNTPAPEGQFHRDGYRSIVDSMAEPEQTRVFFNKKYRRFRVGRFEFRKNYLELTQSEAEEFLALVKDPKFPYEEAVQIVEVNRAAQQAAERSILDSVPAGQGVVRGAMTAGDILTAKDKQRFAAGSEFRPGANASLLNPHPTTQQSAYSLQNPRG